MVSTAVKCALPRFRDPLLPLCTYICESKERLPPVSPPMMLPPTPKKALAAKAAMVRPFTSGSTFCTRRCVVVHHVTVILLMDVCDACGESR